MLLLATVLFFVSLVRPLISVDLGGDVTFSYAEAQLEDETNLIQLKGAIASSSKRSQPTPQYVPPGTVPRAPRMRMQLRPFRSEPGADWGSLGHLPENSPPSFNFPPSYRSPSMESLARGHVGHLPGPPPSLDLGLNRAFHAARRASSSWSSKAHWSPSEIWSPAGSGPVLQWSPHSPLGTVSEGPSDEQPPPSHEEPNSRPMDDIMWNADAQKWEVVYNDEVRSPSLPDEMPDRSSGRMREVWPSPPEGLTGTTVEDSLGALALNVPEQAPRVCGGLIDCMTRRSSE